MALELVIIYPELFIAFQKTHFKLEKAKKQRLFLLILLINLIIHFAINWGQGTLVEENLKFYAEQISDEGIWDISWDWESYSKEYVIARRYWKAILAIERYGILKSFNWKE